MQVLCTGKMKGTNSDNASITAVGSCSVPLNSEGVGWGILKEQELAGVHKKLMDIGRSNVKLSIGCTSGQCSEPYSITR